MDVETLEELVVSLLKEQGKKLACAESCTGGLLSKRITDVPGSSSVFDMGCVTYANQAKEDLLSVSHETLAQYGAVSEQTAREMAMGGVFATDADACVAVTGIAGPGAEGEKPVGLVYIACYMKDKVRVEKYQFKGNRSKIREQSVVKALDLLRRSILDNYRKS